MVLRIVSLPNQAEDHAPPTPPRIKEVIPNCERRYLVAWAKKGDREVVIVYDKANGKIVYRANSKDRHNAYPYIMNYYEKGNCCFLGEQDLRKFE